MIDLYTTGQKILKSPGKKSREIKQSHLFREIAFLAVKLFPSSKIDFWSFLKLQKMKFGPKKFREIDLFDFRSFSGLDFFKFSGSL